MDGIADFFSPAAGQRRRAWLDGVDGKINEALRYYLGAGGVDQRVGAAANLAQMFSPGADVMDATTASGDLMGARSPMEAATAGAAMVGALGSMFIPGNAQRAGEALTRFGADESGALRLGGDIAAERGAQIMDMLKSGRASEVTDEMLDLGDPVANARLNEWLFNNYDLSMDAKSRARRAKGMGFKSPALHGTDTDITAFDAMRPGGSPGVYTTGDTDVADAYARRRQDLTGEGSPNYIPVVQDPKATSRFGSDYRVTYDPTNIRSRFARFDPRLAHLRNLSAGVGGLGLASMFMPPSEEQQ